MAHARNRVEVASDSPDLKTIKHMVPVELFFAGQIIDGNGDVSNRLLLRIKGDKQFYFLFAKGVEENMKKPAPWLQDALERKYNETFGSAEGEDGPADMEAGVPAGNPLE